MNKKISSLCLLVVVSLLFTLSAAVAVQESDGHAKVQSPHVNAWYSFISNYINNQWFFGMRVVYDIFCFTVGYTYVFWFNDGGYNFYKCYNSVPHRVEFY